MIEEAAVVLRLIWVIVALFDLIWVGAWVIGTIGKALWAAIFNRKTKRQEYDEILKNHLSRNNQNS